jgi:ATPase subunit of ABC transporter with duplicated ATPase domains
MRKLLTIANARARDELRGRLRRLAAPGTSNHKTVAEFSGGRRRRAWTKQAMDRRSLE